MEKLNHSLWNLGNLDRVWWHYKAKSLAEKIDSSKIFSEAIKKVPNLLFFDYSAGTMYLSQASQ